MYVRRLALQTLPLHFLQGPPLVPRCISNAGWVGGCRQRVGGVGDGRGHIGREGSARIQCGLGWLLCEAGRRFHAWFSAGKEFGQADVCKERWKCEWITSQGNRYTGIKSLVLIFIYAFLYACHEKTLLTLIYMEVGEYD